MRALASLAALLVSCGGPQTQWEPLKLEALDETRDRDSERVTRGRG